MHDIEAEMLSLNGVPVFDKPLTSSLPIAHCKYNDIDELWLKSLDYLANQSPWLARKMPYLFIDVGKSSGLLPTYGRNI